MQFDVGHANTTIRSERNASPHQIRSAGALHASIQNSVDEPAVGDPIPEDPVDGAVRECHVPLVAAPRSALSAGKTTGGHRHRGRLHGGITHSAAWRRAVRPHRPLTTRARTSATRLLFPPGARGTPGARGGHDRSPCKPTPVGEHPQRTLPGVCRHTRRNGLTTAAQRRYRRPVLNDRPRPRRRAGSTSDIVHIFVTMQRTHLGRRWPRCRVLAQWPGARRRRGNISR